MRIFLKSLKIVGFSLATIFLLLYILFYYYSSPKSNQKITDFYKNSKIQPKITLEHFKNFEFRKIAMVTDTTLPTIVFVHGTIGSVNDFQKYLSDSILQQKANMISYDRIGYNYKDKNNVQESIAFEQSMLQYVLSELNLNKTIVVGYSYGGPIALAITHKIKKIILIAPAVYSKVEPMPWALNLYKWKFTRWLLPNVWQQASKEKLSHKKELELFENNWNSTPNKVISIHGTKDWIVPIENSLFLQRQFLDDQFKLIEIDNAGHELLWTNSNSIKQQLLKELD